MVKESQQKYEEWKSECLASSAIAAFDISHQFEERHRDGFIFVDGKNGTVNTYVTCIFCVLLLLFSFFSLSISLSFKAI